ncbi:MAG TPA: ABC transporter substrate-binding protein [Candidatus Lustribacter sp.]|jgi:NitT/TauT family transport system substrate-binding protein|nr:ABC transporter substrate-binding protein [Candidatus Lustribacter sp.]
MRFFLSIMVAAAFLMPLTTSAAVIAPLPVTIRIGSSYNDSNVEAYYAVANGFFKQVGLNVEMTAFNNGAAAAAALASGALDVAVQPPMQVAQAVIGGLPFVVVAAGAINSVSAPAAWVCVSATSPIRTAKDLEGKTIAINSLKSSSQNLLDAWLAKEGADLSKIHFLELPSAQMAPALQRGTVDAVELFEPAFTVAKASGNVRVLAIPTAAMAAPRDEFLQTTWYTTKQFATQNREAIRRFASAIYMAARWANAHPHDSGVILAELSKLDPGIVATMTRARYAESLQPRDLLPELDNGFKFGLLSRPVSPTELLNTSL